MKKYCLAKKWEQFKIVLLYMDHPVPDRGRPTRQDHLLSLPRVRTEAGKRRFAYRADQQLNALPVDFTGMSAGRFRRALKASLLATDQVT